MARTLSFQPGPRGWAMAMVVGVAAAGAWGGHLGSPDLEPALAGRSDIVFYEDFEQADFYTHWGQSSAPSTCQRVGDPAFDGAASLRVRIPQGQHTGMAWQWRFSRFGLAEPEEIHFRYYMYLDDSFRRTSSSSTIGKLPGIAGTYGVAGWGGRPSHGDDGWSARMVDVDHGSAVEMGYYCYHADMTGVYGDNWTWGPDAYLERNRWYCIEVYGRMNSITAGAGNNDGILRGWVDGQAVFEKTDIRFRDVDRLKIECIWFNVYVGGSWSAEQDMDAYFDNMVIAGGYIGPLIGEGDANLDGKVDVFDLAILANNYDAGGGKTWVDGDFDADLDVDISDLAILANHYQCGTLGSAGLTTGGSSTGLTTGGGSTGLTTGGSSTGLTTGGSSTGLTTGEAIPEPATILIVTAAGLPMLLKRRRYA